MAKSLKELMESEDQKWLRSVTSATNTPWLLEQLRTVKSDSRRAIIQARIKNINHLVV